MQLSTFALVVSIPISCFAVSGCGWRSTGPAETETDDTDSATDTVDTHSTGTEIDGTETITTSDTNSDSETTQTDDTETNSDTCASCGSVANGDTYITGDQAIDVYLRAFVELKQKLDFSVEETRSILNGAAAEWEIDDAGLWVTESAEQLKIAIRADIDEHTRDGVSVAGNPSATCRILEEETLETQILCETESGCNCDLAPEEIVGDAICNGVCQGPCTGKCYCEADGVSGFQDAALCDDSIQCDSNCRGGCEAGCLGEITPPICDSDCVYSRACQQMTQQCSIVHLSCNTSPFTLTYIPVSSLDEAAATGFESRMAKLTTMLESLWRETVLLRTLFDSGYADSVGLDSPGPMLEFELSQSYINNIAKGEFVGPPCKAYCVGPAINESAELQRTFYGVAMPYIEAQLTLLSLIEL